MDDNFTPNIPAAIDFLKAFHPESAWHLVAIKPDAKANAVEAQTFRKGKLDEMFEWLSKRQGTCNCYFHVNKIKQTIKNRKASKPDVSAALYLHVDVDEPDDKVLERLKQFEPTPTAVIFSGGGYQAFWRLDQPTKELERIEQINRGLAKELGGDNCHNIDRIMRVPGTLNVPNTKKREQGRELALAYVVDELTDWNRTHAISEFGRIEASEWASSQIVTAPPGDITLIDVETLPKSVREETKEIIRHGDDPERPRNSADPRYPSRSEPVFRVTCDLVRAGCAYEVIAGILLNKKMKISESVLEKRDPKAYAYRQITSAVATLNDNWPDVTKGGRPRPTLRNTIFAILRLGLHCEFDEFHNRKTIGGYSLQTYQGELSDDGCSVLRHEIIKEFDFDPLKENTREAANVLCLENRYHPIRDYLNHLVWDRSPRLDSWLHDYLSAEDTPLNRAFARLTLLAAVRRIRNPGVKFDTLLVLEGAQGSGKSTAIRILAGDGNFSDQQILILDTKAQMEATEGVWLFEICELEGISRAETSKVKAFASRQVDRARPAYARFSERRPRQCVFIGTTNDAVYLRDQTGNRRFWPVATGEINLDGLRLDRDQLWAEAAYWEAKDEDLALPEDLWEAARGVQEERLEDDPWVDALTRAEGVAIGGMERIASAYLLSIHLDIPPDRQQQHHSKRLAQVMRRLGWDGPKKIRLMDDEIARGYERPARNKK